MNSKIEWVQKYKITAIIRSIYGENCHKLVNALYNGGIRIMEFPFDASKPTTEEMTLENIRYVRENYDGQILVGSGTVLSVRQVELTHGAGGQLIVSPNMNPEVIHETVRLGMVSMPGAMTPTEVVTAYENGASFVKVFPASALGSSYLKALRSPLNHIPLIAVGGISSSNASEFMNAGAVGLGIGGNLANKSWVEAGEFEKITEEARKTIRAIQG